jgi:hypothetical protein
MPAKVPDPRDLFTMTRAEFSPTRSHRWWWEAVWDDHLPPLVMCALNPSTADEWEGDPTVNRMVVRGRRGGFGRFIMVNAAAYRSTDPKALYTLAPEVAIGDRCDEFLALAAKRCFDNGGMFVLGWGVHLDKTLPGRAEQVVSIISKAGVQPMAYKVTKAGYPGHPLYLGYDVQAKPYPLVTEA